MADTRNQFLVGPDPALSAEALVVGALFLDALTAEALADEPLAFTTHKKGLSVMEGIV